MDAFQKEKKYQQRLVKAMNKVTITLAVTEWNFLVGEKKCYFLWRNRSLLLKKHALTCKEFYTLTNVHNIKTQGYTMVSFDVKNLVTNIPV